MYIEASENALSIGHLHPGDGFLSAEVAKRYVQSRHSANWGEAALEFGGTTELRAETDNAVGSLQPHLLDELVDNGVKPVFRAGALYQYPDRTLQIEIVQPVNSDIDWIEWRVSVSRRLESDEGSETKAKDQLLAILSDWDTDPRGCP